MRVARVWQSASIVGASLKQHYMATQCLTLLLKCATTVLNSATTVHMHCLYVCCIDIRWSLLKACLLQGMTFWLDAPLTMKDRTPTALVKAPVGALQHQASILTHCDSSCPQQSRIKIWSAHMNKQFLSGLRMAAHKGWLAAGAE